MIKFSQSLALKNQAHGVHVCTLRLSARQSHRYRAQD